MKMGIAFCVLILLSGQCLAANRVSYTGPDCSKDTDSRIFGGLWDSFSPKGQKYHNYMIAIAGKGTTLNIKRLSSEKISKKEAERLMLRSAKHDGYGV